MCFVLRRNSNVLIVQILSERTWIHYWEPLHSFSAGKTIASWFITVVPKYILTVGCPCERQKSDYFHFEIRILVSWTCSFKYTWAYLIFLLTNVFPSKFWFWCYKIFSWVSALQGWRNWSLSVSFICISMLYLCCIIIDHHYEQQIITCLELEKIF